MEKFFEGSDFATYGMPTLVYVRPVSGKEVLAFIKTKGITVDTDFEPEQTLYAVHRADGERLAVLTDRESAFSAAYAHELTPLTVH